MYGILLVPVITISEEEVKTSLGQPTTLQITVTGQPMPEINWMKNGNPIDHLILKDNSLYINPTTENDQSKYEVTATNSEGSSHRTIQLIVLHPHDQFKPRKLHDHLLHYHCILSLSMTVGIDKENYGFPKCI